ncbi:MAG: DMT family transporter [Rhodospirillaceae bacterium]|nr:DMT family transporter [Rhodospirillaceae bacterium]
MVLMRGARSELLPSAAIACVAATWGVYWLPLRHIDGLGLPGAWATSIMVLLATLALVPGQIVRWRRLANGGWPLLISGLLAGTAFILYSNSYAFTSIVNVLFLFYISPVWSTLMSRVFLGERISPIRVAAIVAAFGGLAIFLGENGQWPIPRNVGDWMTLSSGITWSLATIVIRKYQGPDADPARRVNGPGAYENTFMFFGGGLIAAVLLPFLLLPDPIGALPPVSDFGPYLPWLVGLALLWWVPSQFMLMWGVPRVSPGRVGILLMAEALFGSFTAALFSDEPFGLRQITGGLLILGAATVDTLVVRSEIAPRQTKRIQPAVGQ